MFVLITAVSLTPANAYVNISGTISSDTTLGKTFPAADGIYIVTGDVTVSNCTLTVEAGVVIKFDNLRSMFIGTTTTPGTLRCQGTAALPITFTSNQVTPTRGYWYNLYFRYTSDASVLDYTTIQYGGGANSCIVYLENSNATFNNCNINNSSTYGMSITGDSAPTLTSTTITTNASYGVYSINTSSPTFTSCTISSNGSYGVYAYTSGTPSFTSCAINSNTGYGIYGYDVTCRLSATNCSFQSNTTIPLRMGANRIGSTSGNTFTSNGSNYMEILGDTVAVDATWRNQGIPYRIIGEVYIRGMNGVDFMTTVTVSPGTVVQFNDGVGLTIGHDTDPNNPGSLVANAASADAIIFENASSKWSGFYFSNYTHDFSTILNNCILRNGGNGRHTIHCNYADPTITACTITSTSGTSSNSGIYMLGSTSAMWISNCTISRFASYGIYPNASSPNIVDCIIENNGSHGIYMSGACTPLIEGNTIRTNSGYGIYCADASQGPYIQDNIVTGNTATYTLYIYARYCPRIIGNTWDKDLYIVAETLTLDATWEGQAKSGGGWVGYYMSGGFTVYAKDGADQVTTLTLLEGAILRFPSCNRLYIGHDSDTNYPGGLICQGTETNPVIFTSQSTPVGAAQWLGIYYARYANSAKCIADWTIIEGGSQYCSYTYYYSVHANYCSPTFNNCIIRYNGYFGFYAANASPVLNQCQVYQSGWENIYWETCNGTITDSVIADSGGGYDNIQLTGQCNTVITNNIISSAGSYGLYCSATNTYPTITGNSFIGNADRPIYIYARCVDKIGTPLNTYLYNGIGGGLDTIYVVGDTISVDALWLNQYTPYYISGDVSVIGTYGTDSITKLTIQPGAELKFGSTCGFWIGTNTSTSPGGLIAVGTADARIKMTGWSESAGYWDGVYYYQYGGSSNMEYCDVYYGGYSSNENIYVYACSPTFSNCKFYYGSGGNVFVTNSPAAPTFTNCEIAYCSGQGLYSQTSASPILTNCSFHHNTSYGIYVYNGATVTVTDSTIEDNTSYGLYANGTGDRPVMTRCAFNRNTTAYPVYIAARYVKDLVNCTYSGNTYEFIYVYGDTIPFDSVWEARDPYYIAGDITVLGNDGPDTTTTLTINAGAQLRFGSTCGLYLGNDSTTTARGVVRTLGTSTSPVVFTAHNSTSPGYWDGVYFSRYSGASQLDYTNILYGGYSSYENVYINYNTANVFNNCQIKYGSGPNVYLYNYAGGTFNNCEIDNASGGQGFQINTQSTATINNCDIHHNNSYGVYLVNTSTVSMLNTIVRNNTSYGLYCNASADAPVVTDCQFNNNATYPIFIYASRVNGLVSATFTGNTYQMIQVRGDTITTDSIWQNLGIPYYIDSTQHVWVQGTNGADGVTTLTIQPGATLKFQSVYLWIGHDTTSTLPGALIANGTATQPITFTTWNASPAPGQWYGIYFANYNRDDITSMNNCVVEYGGASSYDNIQCNASSPVIRNSIIRYAQDYNVRAVSADANPSLINCEIYGNSTSTTVGVYASPGTVQITGGKIYGHASYGVYIDETTLGAPVTVIDGTTIENNAVGTSGGYGIYITNANTRAEIENCLIQNNNIPTAGYGIYITGSALPIIGGAEADMNSFKGHRSYAVYNATTTTCINARYNYWGKSGGPLDTSFFQDACVNNGNNNQGAQRVSNDVDYLNWINDDFTPTPAPTNTPTPVPTNTPIPCFNDGDVNNDGVLTVGDAQLAFMISLGSYTPTIEEECSADCNGQDGVTMDDVQCIFMAYLGQDCSCADPLAKGAAYIPRKPVEVLKTEHQIELSQVASSEDELIADLAANNLIWIEDVAACEDDLVQVKIHISNPGNAIDAFGFALEFNPESLEYVENAHQELQKDWVMFGCNESTPGELRVAGFLQPTDVISVGSNSVLVTLTFKVTCDPCHFGQTFNLNFTDLTDDLVNWNGLGGTFTFCDVKPVKTQGYLEGRTLWVPSTGRQNHSLE